MLHFVDQTAHINRRDVVKSLKQHLSDYDKSADVYAKLQVSEEAAIRRASALRDYHVRNGDDSRSNPSTCVDKLVDLLNQLGSEPSRSA